MANPEKKKRNDAIQEKFFLGWGYKRIAAYFGVDWSTVRNVIKRRGLVRPKQ